MIPIHKFNGGRGATLCNKCAKIITEGLTEDLLCNDCGPHNQENNSYKYELYRGDGLIKKGNAINWIEWKDDGTFLKAHLKPDIGRSFLLDFSALTYTWMTTTVVEIIEEREDYIEFKTKNSSYWLYIK
jgi:hypothetical protein